MRWCICCSFWKTCWRSCSNSCRSGMHGCGSKKESAASRVLVGSRWSWLLRKWDWICARKHRGRFGTKTPMHTSYKNKRKGPRINTKQYTKQYNLINLQNHNLRLEEIHKCFKRHETLLLLLDLVPKLIHEATTASAHLNKGFHAGFWLKKKKQFVWGAIQGGSRAAVAKLEFLNSISDETLHWDVTELQRNATQL